jgi:hypothetical protein
MVGYLQKTREPTTTAALLSMGTPPHVDIFATIRGRDRVRPASEGSELERKPRGK